MQLIRMLEAHLFSRIMWQVSQMRVNATKSGRPLDAVASNCLPTAGICWHLVAQKLHNVLCPTFFGSSLSSSSRPTGVHQWIPARCECTPLACILPGQGASKEPLSPSPCFKPFALAGPLQVLLCPSGSSFQEMRPRLEDVLVALRIFVVFTMCGSAGCFFQFFPACIQHLPQHLPLNCPQPLLLPLFQCPSLRSIEHRRCNDCFKQP